MITSTWSQLAAPSTTTLTLTPDKLTPVLSMPLMRGNNNLVATTTIHPSSSGPFFNRPHYNPPLLTSPKTTILGTDDNERMLVDSGKSEPLLEQAFNANKQVEPSPKQTKKSVGEEFIA